MKQGRKYKKEKGWIIESRGKGKEVNEGSW